MKETFGPLELKSRVDAVRERMLLSAQKAGRKPEDIVLCAACKAQDSETVRACAGTLIDAFGENRMQEMAVHLRDGAYSGKPCHFIGHLQTNKVKDVVGQAALIESVGSERLVKAVSDTALKKGLVQDILIEVNLGRETSKAGVLREELEPLLDYAAHLPALRVRGLMAIPPAMADEAETRRYFAEMRRLMEGLRAQRWDNVLPDILSMGMSDSYTWAIEEGSTLIRVGRAIFGERA